MVRGQWVPSVSKAMLSFAYPISVPMVCQVHAVCPRTWPRINRCAVFYWPKFHPCRTGRLQMQFYNFPWNKLHLDQKSWCVQLRASDDESIQALLIDAAYCGLRPNQQDVWAIAGRLCLGEQPARELVIIGLRRTGNSQLNAGGYQWGLQLPGHRVIICPAYHVALRIVGNPLELHWRWSETESERLAVLNVESATKAEQVTEIWQQARIIHEHLRPRGGGPTPVSVEEMRCVVNGWYEKKARYPSMTIERYCVNIGIDRKTFYRWKKRLERIDSI
jgi:hypothetical protein